MRQAQTPLTYLKYWTGQRLNSADLNLQIATNNELVRRHNFAVHGAFGVSSGFAVTFNASNVEVACGLAYDRSGRAIASLRKRRVSLPAVAGPFATLMAFFDPEAPDTVGLAWQSLTTSVPNGSVPLARVVPSGGSWTPAKSFSATPVRRLARPRLAFGQTVESNTPWEAWKDPSSGQSIGVQTTVDTSASGFTATPLYFANAVRGQASAVYDDAWFPSIGDSDNNSFTFRLFLARIELERFLIANSVAKLAATPGLSNTISLTDVSPFDTFDTIATLAGRMTTSAVVTAINNNTLTLGGPGLSSNFSTLVIGATPQTASIVKAASGASFSITASDSSSFASGDIVVRITDATTSNLAVLTKFQDDGALALSAAINNLAVGDSIGKAVQKGTVQTVVAPNVVTVDHPGNFNQGDVIALIQTSPESTSPVTLADKSGSTLTLSAAIPSLTMGSVLGVATALTTVTGIVNSTGNTVLTLDSAQAFKVGNLVVLADASSSLPARVLRVNTNKNSVTLDGAGASFHSGALLRIEFAIRATVVGVLSAGLQLEINNSARFPTNSFIALIDDSLSASSIAQITASTPGILTLSAALPNLKAGSVIALCTAPATATVLSSDPSSGTVHLSSSAGFQTGGYVSASPARSGVATIIQTSSNGIVTADPIQDLAIGDTLGVVNIHATASVTTITNPNAIQVDDASAIRIGDIVGPLAGWTQRSGSSSVASVSGKSLVLSQALDGALIKDEIGYASLQPPFFWLKLQAAPTSSVAGSNVTIAGRDALTGQTKSESGLLAFVFNKLVLLYFPSSGPFLFRPEEITASVPFTGDADAFATQARRDGLYVQWVGCYTQPFADFTCDGESIATVSNGCDCQETRS